MGAKETSVKTADTKLVIWLTSQLNHSIHNLSWHRGIPHMVSVLYFGSQICEKKGVFNYETSKMDKSSYKSAEKYLGKGEKATVILAEPQVLRQWDDV